MECRNSRQRNRGTSERSGSLIVEAVISMVLLATATYAVARLAGSAAQLSQQADQRLSATLTAENTLERLRGLAPEEVESEASRVAETMRGCSGCQVAVSTRPFAGGLHIRVDVTHSEAVRVTLHDWRLDQPKRDSSGPQDSTSSEDQDD